MAKSLVMREDGFPEFTSPRNKKPIVYDLTGQQFGRLSVIRISRTATGPSAWVCRCLCGNYVLVTSGELRISGKKSCSQGCLRRKAGDPLAHNTKHKSFSIWSAMIRRCHSHSSREYSYYGGRGIAVCERWRSSYEAFLRDMGPPPQGHQIDRIDNDGPYSPENCRWATRVENCRNKSSCRIVTFRGTSKPLAAWAEEFGIHRTTITSRIDAGWSIERALTQAPLGSRK